MDKELTLHNNLSQIRKEKNLSQNDLAEKLNISREHLAKIETAKRNISLPLLIDIADCLKVKVKDLIEF